MTQDVDPETFYLVGKRLHELAGQMYDAFATNVTILGETGAMAGSDDEGTAWAASYDARAREILDAVNDLTLAMENYGGVVIQAGHNHAIAEHNATPGGGGTPPERPPDPQSVAGVLTAPPSAGGPGQGLIDNALGLVDQIGVPVPDGIPTRSTRRRRRGTGWPRSTRPRLCPRRLTCRPGSSAIRLRPKSSTSPRISANCAMRPTRSCPPAESYRSHVLNTVQPSTICVIN